ncbi:MAG: phosphate ABC transporter substrate-binding protein PstS [Acidimicrobiales bacterium]
MLGVGAVCSAAALVGLLNVGAGASVSPRFIHHSGSSVTLNGAGSTFDQPFFTRAFYDYHEANPNVTINYASIGSGGGEGQFEAGTVNFGATDVPMLAADLAKVPASSGPVLQVPVDLGGEAIAYNLPKVPQGMHITPYVLAQIFLGKITKWNDPALVKLNPKANLPDLAITVAHRSDGSGTTFIFTNYLSEVSGTWASQVGNAKSVAWPVGVGGQGNEGVAGIIDDTPGALGYVELDYAIAAKLKYFAVRNPAGKYVMPSKTTVANEAAMKAGITAANFSITDLPVKKSNLKLAVDAYPISGYSWVVVLQDQTNATTGSALATMLTWLTSDTGGQKAAGALDYVPLPPVIVKLATNTIAKMVGPGGTKLSS